MHHPTVFVTPVVERWLEREIAQWVHPMKDRSDDISHHERTLLLRRGARCSSVVRAFAHGAMGRRIDPSWGGPIDLFLVLASAPRLV